MQEITLNNGVKIPVLGFGVFQAKEGDETVQAVQWALEAGYRHIDTAKIYGNEKSVGKAMKESGIQREDIFLTTKLWNEDIRQGNTKKAFEKSLKDLGTNYLDLYLIHWPAEGFEVAWKEMENLYKAGKIKAIGVSNFHKVHLEALEKMATVKPAINQIESHPYFPNQELIDYCKAQGIEVQAWSPLGGSDHQVLSDKVLAEIAEK